MNVYSLWVYVTDHSHVYYYHFHRYSWPLHSYLRFELIFDIRTQAALLILIRTCNLIPLIFLRNFIFLEDCQLSFIFL